MSEIGLYWLMRFSGFQYKEIADGLHIEISSIGTLLAQAKQKFRNAYKQNLRRYKK